MVYLFFKTVFDFYSNLLHYPVHSPKLNDQPVLILYITATITANATIAVATVTVPHPLIPPLLLRHRILNHLIPNLHLIYFLPLLEIFDKVGFLFAMLKHLHFLLLAIVCFKVTVLINDFPYP
jgi:hypothetical protein